MKLFVTSLYRTFYNCSCKSHDIFPNVGWKRSSWPLKCNSSIFSQGRLCASRLNSLITSLLLTPSDAVACQDIHCTITIRLQSQNMRSLVGQEYEFPSLISILSGGAEGLKSCVTHPDENLIQTWTSTRSVPCLCAVEHPIFSQKTEYGTDLKVLASGVWRGRYGE